jgi:hypothetical protein
MQLFILLLIPFLQPTNSLAQQENLIMWSVDRKLRWSDFTPTVDFDGVIEDTLSVAATSLSMMSKIYQYNNRYISFTNAYFHKELSYRDDPHLGDSLFRENALCHEQIHFDIEKTYALMLDSIIYNNYSDIKSHESLKNIVDSIGGIIYSNCELHHDKYDEETIHGLHDLMQKEWDKSVTIRLNMLLNYNMQFYKYIIEYENKNKH